MLTTLRPYCNVYICNFIAPLSSQTCAPYTLYSVSHTVTFSASSAVQILVVCTQGLKKSTEVNRKHDRKKHKAATANKLYVPILFLAPLGGLTAGLQGPRMGAASTAYCALSAGSKPIEEVPKVIPAWQVGAWKARYARENMRRAPCRASSAKVQVCTCGTCTVGKKLKRTHDELLCTNQASTHSRRRKSKKSAPRP